MTATTNQPGAPERGELQRVKKVPVTSTWSCPDCNYQNVYREGIVSDPQNKCDACGTEVIVGAVRETDLVRPPVDGSMSAEQVERARLIVESRGVDLETAQELVYLRDCFVRPAEVDGRAGDVANNVFNFVMKCFHGKRQLYVSDIAAIVGQPATVQARAAAEEIAHRWIAHDLPLRAQVQSVSLVQLRILAEEVIATHLSASRGDGERDETWTRLPPEELEARASADHERRHGDGEQMCGWQPIATAPQNMEFLGGWCHNGQRWVWDRCEYDPRIGWFSRNGGTPTHWMLLPEPPALEEMERGGGKQDVA